MVYRFTLIDCTVTRSPTLNFHNCLLEFVCCMSSCWKYVCCGPKGFASGFNTSWFWTKPRIVVVPAAWRQVSKEQQAS
jgi:hypothetical protein